MAKQIINNQFFTPRLASIQELGASWSNTERPWKLIVQSRGDDELNYRFEEDGTRHRRSIFCTDSGVWQFGGREDSSSDSGHMDVARQLITDLFWWGDLDHVYLHTSLSKEGFIPPVEEG